MYSVEKSSEGAVNEVVGTYESEDTAIRAAQGIAAGLDQDVVSVVVFDDDGNLVWDNEGDWRNAIRQ